MGAQSLSIQHHNCAYPLTLEGKVNIRREAYSCISVHFALCLRFIEKAEHGGDEGNSVAEEAIDPI